MYPLEIPLLEATSKTGDLGHHYDLLSFAWTRDLRVEIAATLLTLFVGCCCGTCPGRGGGEVPDLAPIRYHHSCD